MTSEVVSEIEAEARELRAGGLVPEGLEDQLDKSFDDVADESLAAASAPGARAVGGARAGLGKISSLAELRKHADGQVWGRR